MSANAPNILGEFAVIQLYLPVIAAQQPAEGVVLLVDSGVNLLPLSLNTYIVRVMGCPCTLSLYAHLPWQVWQRCMITEGPDGAVANGWWHASSQFSQDKDHFPVSELPNGYPVARAAL
jgi:hypothetical protein